MALFVAMLPAISRAETPPKDPSLPHATPQALQQLSDTRIRQKIMLQSQARYAGRCVCRYQTRDSKGRSCKGRHEIIKASPQPICYPEQVTPEMITRWKQQQAKR
jgi:hypothetical protein